MCNHLEAIYIQLTFCIAFIIKVSLSLSVCVCVCVCVHVCLRSSKQLDFPVNDCSLQSHTLTHTHRTHTCPHLRYVCCASKKKKKKHLSHLRWTLKLCVCVCVFIFTCLHVPFCMCARIVSERGSARPCVIVCVCASVWRVSEQDSCRCCRTAESTIQPHTHTHTHTHTHSTQHKWLVIRGDKTDVQVCVSGVCLWDNLILSFQSENSTDRWGNTSC